MFVEEEGADRRPPDLAKRPKETHQIWCLEHVLDEPCNLSYSDRYTNIGRGRACPL
jgi:hypothetical protein